MAVKPLEVQIRVSKGFVGIWGKSFNTVLKIEALLDNDEDIVQKDTFSLKELFGLTE